MQRGPENWTQFRRMSKFDRRAKEISPKRAHCTRLYFLSHSYIIPVLITAIALNLPKYFETKFVPVGDFDDPVVNGTTNGTDAGEEEEKDVEYWFVASDLRNDPVYIR